MTYLLGNQWTKTKLLCGTRSVSAESDGHKHRPVSKLSILAPHYFFRFYSLQPNLSVLPTLKLH